MTCAQAGARYGSTRGYLGREATRAENHTGGRATKIVSKSIRSVEISLAASLRCLRSSHPTDSTCAKDPECRMQRGGLHQNRVRYAGGLLYLCRFWPSLLPAPQMLPPL